MSTKSKNSKKRQVNPLVFVQQIADYLGVDPQRMKIQYLLKEHDTQPNEFLDVDPNFNLVMTNAPHFAISPEHLAALGNRVRTEKTFFSGVEEAMFPNPHISFRLKAPVPADPAGNRPEIKNYGFARLTPKFTRKDHDQLAIPLLQRFSQYIPEIQDGEPYTSYFKKIQEAERVIRQRIEQDFAQMENLNLHARDLEETLFRSDNPKGEKGRGKKNSTRKRNPSDELARKQRELAERFARERDIPTGEFPAFVSSQPAPMTLAERFARERDIPTGEYPAFVPPSPSGGFDSKKKEWEQKIADVLAKPKKAEWEQQLAEHIADLFAKEATPYWWEEPGALEHGWAVAPRTEGSEPRKYPPEIELELIKFITGFHEAPSKLWEGWVYDPQNYDDLFAENRHGLYMHVSPEPILEWRGPEMCVSSLERGAPFAEHRQRFCAVLEGTARKLFDRDVWSGFEPEGTQLVRQHLSGTEIPLPYKPSNHDEGWIEVPTMRPREYLVSPEIFEAGVPLPTDAPITVLPHTKWVEYLWDKYNIPVEQRGKTPRNRNPRRKRRRGKKKKQTKNSKRSTVY